MTVHLFKVYVGHGSMSLSDLETRIDNWVASNAEWTGDNLAHTLRALESDPYGDGGQTYYGIEVRFQQEDTKSNILQKFTDKLENKVNWYRVGYHECHKDEPQGTPCSFDPAVDPEAMADQWTAKDVTIPSGVPDFPDAAYNNS